MSRFWHRRISEAIILVALAIVAVYVMNLFDAADSPVSYLAVSDLAVVLAGITVVYAFITYLWSPKQPSILPTLIAYLLLSTTAGVLIYTTGGLGSPFNVLWVVVGVFAGVFGLLGIVPLFVATIGYLAWQYMSSDLMRSDVVMVALIGELPLVVSYVLWHRRVGGKAPASSDGRSYHELATELSQVTGQADIVINAIADGVISIDSHGLVQLINPAAQHIIGWGRQDAVQLNYKSVLQLRDKDGAELSDADDPVGIVLATNKEVERKDLTIITTSGKKIMTSVIVSPTGQPGSGVIVVFRDVTHEREEEHAQAEFISTASHEMRTPVASIEGYLGLALNPATATIDPKARDYIEKAHQSAQHLGRLFQDLLDVTKADDNRLQNHPKVLDTVTFVGDIADGLKHEADEKSLRMIFRPMPTGNPSDSNERRLNPVFYVNCDPDHLREVVANLIENAIKYTPKGDVTIDVTGDNEHVIVSIADSGIGIPTEDIPHLFQKFYRVDNSQTREIGGTGLGLYLSRRLSEAMGGRIRVESQFGKGSTFFLELPRLSSEEATRLIESSALTPVEASAPVITPLAVGSFEQAPAASPASPPLQPPPTPVQPPASPSTIPPQPLPQQAPTSPPQFTPITTVPTAPETRSNSIRIPIRSEGAPE